MFWKFVPLRAKRCLSTPAWWEGWELRGVGWSAVALALVGSEHTSRADT